MDDIKKDIFYRPQIDIERNYDTIGTIPKTTPEEEPQAETPSDEEKLIERADEIEDALIRIRGVLPLLPEGVPEILRDIVDKLIFQTEDEKDTIETIEEKPEEERTDVYENDTESEGIDPEEPIIDDDGFIWNMSEPDTYTIKVVRCKENSDLALEQYLKDSLDIKEYFATKLNGILEEYIYPLLSVMGEAGVNNVAYLNMEYDGTCVTGYDTDDRHLNDTIARNQTIVNEQTRLFEKTHDANTTLAILMAFDVTAQERIRYYEEQYDMGVDNFVSMYKRNTLEKVRKQYNYKYDKARANVLKYLDSAAELTRNILVNSLDANTAKCYLLTQDVNIFAKTEYQAAAYENATNFGAAEVASGINTTVTKATETTNQSSSTASSLTDSLSSSINDLKNTASDAINSILNR